MIYTNLLFFLTAIFLFSLDKVPERPLLPWWASLFVFVLLAVVFDWTARRLYGRRTALRSAGYFSTEKRLSVIAILCFGATLFLCDAKYYLSWLSWNGRLPSLLNVAGLCLFFFFFLIMWRAARTSYQTVFGRAYTTKGFLVSNIRANLPIVLPWVILSFVSDLAALLPWPALQNLIRSDAGDLVFFVLFVVMLVLFFPPLVRRLWECRPLPDGEVRRHLVAFCEKQKFHAEIYLWPLFEGRVLTAGVIGIVPGLRYILITPALIETMSLPELEAVMAHEIGHVKKLHLLLYLLLIGGFSVFVGYLLEPLLSFALAQEFVFDFVTESPFSSDTLLTVIEGGLLLAVMLLYFRYLFGYFLRNFERQADLHVFTALGDSQPLISAFEKIAVISGDIRDQPSWHHFGIGERVAYLEKCEQDPSWIKRHTRKLRLSLLGYAAVCILGVVLVGQLPIDQAMQRYQENRLEAMIMQKVKADPDNAVWLRLAGDILARKNMDAEALDAYQRALELEPSNPELMNNLAWLYLTSDDPGLRDPLQALTLARSAAVLQPKGFVLDTLATAYWANGFVEEAIGIENKAISTDPDEKAYYQSQIEKFSHLTYREVMQGPKPNNADKRLGDKIRPMENGG